MAHVNVFTRSLGHRYMAGTSVVTDRSRPNIAPVHRAVNTTSPATESFQVLEAFFIGRALAETLNERLGNVAGDTLTGIANLDTNLRRAISELRDEVMARAHREMNAAAGNADAYGTSFGRTSSVPIVLTAATPDLGEAVDNLRAEVASARALLKQIKQQRATLN